MNPVLKTFFVSSNKTLTEIIKKSPNPDRYPLLQSTMHLLDSNIKKNDSLQEAGQVKITPEDDPNLCIIFLSAWGRACLRVQQKDQALVLLRHASNLLTSQTPFEIRSHVLYLKALLALFDGNEMECESVLKDNLKHFTKTAPAWNFWYMQLAFFLANRGLANELLSNPPENVSEDSIQLRFAMAQYANAVETANISQMESFYQICLKYLNPEESNPFYLRNGPTLLKLLKRDFFHISDWPMWGIVILNLLQNKPLEALRFTRQMLAKKGQELRSPFEHHGFASFNLIRCELASGNADTALRLLSQKNDVGSRHYFDDFFFARISLLKGKKEDAARYFSQVVHSAEKYEAMGRLDFEIKLACELSPTDLMSLSRSLEKQSSIRKSAQDKKSITPIPSKNKDSIIPTIIGNSLAIRKVRETIHQIAPLNATTLIQGETGTGKELIARALHNESPRVKEPFVAINCGAIVETLLESELFGHEKGAFTGAEKSHRGLFLEAGKGTLFLDEIGDMPLRLQVALLRTLENSEVRPVGGTKTYKIECRIVAATNADLEKMCREKLFRNDLYFRLKRLLIKVPTLRERKEDIPELAQYFLNLGRPPETHAQLSDILQKTLSSYQWPGNVRELQNEIERMRLMNSDKIDYQIEDLDPSLFPQGLSFRNVEVSDPLLISKSSSDNRFDEKSSADSLLQERIHTLEKLVQSQKRNLRRLDQIKGLFRHFKKLTRLELVKTMQISKGTATRDLKQLCEERFVEKIKPTASSTSHYFVIKEDVEHHPLL
jgi:transcriptional regulator with PAS, ATPase and Fis domain